MQNSKVDVAGIVGGRLDLGLPDAAAELLLDVQNERVDIGPGALDEHFDRSVRLVPHEPGHRVLLRDAVSRVAKAHPLDVTREDNMFGSRFHA
jgi:hypothetical protein